MALLRSLDLKRAIQALANAGNSCFSPLAMISTVISSSRSNMALLASIHTQRDRQSPAILQTPHSLSSVSAQSAAAVRHGDGSADSHRCHVYPVDQRRAAHPADQSAALAGTVAAGTDRADNHGSAQVPAVAAGGLPRVLTGGSGRHHFSG